MHILDLTPRALTGGLLRHAGDTEDVFQNISKEICILHVDPSLFMFMKEFMKIIFNDVLVMYLEPYKFK